jgi:hypothetical protein
MKFNAPQNFAPPPPSTLGVEGVLLGTTGPTKNATVHGVSGESELLLSDDVTITIQSVTISWSRIEVEGYIEIEGVISLYQTAPSGSITLPCYDLPVTITDGLEVINNSNGGNYIVSMFYKEQI